MKDYYKTDTDYSRFNFIFILVTISIFSIFIRLQILHIHWTTDWIIFTGH